jgi:hypothetical protein
MRRESMRPGTDKKLTREFTRPANIVAPVVMVSNKLRRAVRRGGDSRINNLEHFPLKMRHIRRYGSSWCIHPV